MAIFVALIEFLRYQITINIDAQSFPPYYIALVTGVLLAVGNYIILNKLLKKYIEQQAKLKQTESLYKLGIELGSFRDVASNLEIAVKQVLDLLKTDFVALALYNQRKNEIQWRFVAGNKTDKHKMIRHKKGEGVAGLCIERRTIVKVEEYPHKIPLPTADNMPIMKVEKLVSGIAVPLTYEEQIYGAIFIAHRKFYQYNDDEIFILYGIANQLGVLLEHSRLYQEIESLATVAERERLAREIHDGVAQTIGYVKLQLKKLQRLLEEEKISDAKVIMKDITDAIEQSYEEVRDSIHGLKDKELFSKGLHHWIGVHAKNYENQHKIQVEVDFLDQTTSQLSEIAKIQIGRIIQEALNNIRKHAQATQVKITVGRDENNQTFIEIADNGKGFDCNGSPEGHYGLTIMEERANSIGGTMVIESAKGKGTKVIVKIPHSENERRDFSWI
ncbi:GAF domain-containing sensor histidine kinase [Desulfuribacillus stibiiarsenatis]|uniref:GAF domain-containing sensor histidine kinase n=1 Tax=Desulfuribacillus stibiiarsenatis TaxID=1390249 RepID=UPI001C4079BD|nr:GAF domain-containing sensor histidine kinase [Desulfuribacillus stibiiarsenatis]